MQKHGGARFLVLGGSGGRNGYCCLLDKYLWRDLVEVLCFIRVTMEVGLHSLILYCADRARSREVNRFVRVNGNKIRYYNQ